LAESTGLLNERNSRLRNQARSAIEDLRAELSAFGVAKEDLDLLRQAARDLDELFLLVIVGEFNSGKSSLINALLGADILEEGVTPTTTSINILRHGKREEPRWLSEDVLESEHPSPLLQDVALVDTPGTNAVLRRHQQLTEQFIPRSDLVLFITSADRPFTESERAFMEAIRSWGKKVVLVINKIDLLKTERERQQVVTFVAENVQQLLGFRPSIFAVSARGAKDGDPAANGSQFGDLRRFLHETLNAENRVKLKIASPLGVGARIAEKYEAAALARLELLTEDARAGESIQSQLDYYREDMQALFEPRLREVENVVYELGMRGERFFDETFRLARVFDLINVDKVRGDFDREVVADTAEQIDQRVDTIANWMVDREIQVWQMVLEELARRRQARPEERFPAEMGGDFEINRRELIQNITRSGRQAVASFDREAEARALGNTMREAVAQTALVEVGAVGLGAAVAALIGTAAADLTGILAGALVAGLGLYIIPARRRKVQTQFRERTDELRQTLRDSLAVQLQREMQSSLERIQSAVAPYVRFVRSEQDKVSSFHDRLVQLHGEIGSLRREAGTVPFEG
jgi:small GTP-binding protein